MHKLISVFATKAFFSFESRFLSANLPPKEPDFTNY